MRASSGPILTLWCSDRRLWVVLGSPMILLLWRCFSRRMTRGGLRATTCSLVVAYRIAGHRESGGITTGAYRGARRFSTLP